MAGADRSQLLLLGLLYFVQGLPIGFNSKVIPLWARQNGASLAQIGFLSWLGLPWLLKPLFAPIVDGRGEHNDWIVWCSGALGACCFAAALGPGPTVTLGLVLMMNTLAAAQDIAVDALAIDVTAGTADVGRANALQIVGFKSGMLAGGGLLAFRGVNSDSDWPGLFGILGSFVLATVMVAAPRLPSTRRPPSPTKPGASKRDPLRQAHPTPHAPVPPGDGTLKSVLQDLLYAQGTYVTG